MRTDTPTLNAYRKEYETAKSLGAAMLACNAVCVPDGYDNLYILIQNFQRPMVTHNDAADVDYARGLASHVQGVPKTDFESQWTMIETVSGTIAQFAQDIATKHKGILDLVRVYDGFVGDGSEIQGKRQYDLLDCAITFADGGGEIDAASRSQILQVQAACRYMFFGDDGELGSNSDDTDVFKDVLTSLTGNSQLASLTPQGTSTNGSVIYGP